MATMKDIVPLLDDNGKETGVFTQFGDDVEILDRRTLQGDKKQTKVKLNDVDGTLKAGSQRRPLMRAVSLSCRRSKKTTSQSGVCCRPTVLRSMATFFLGWLSFVHK